MKDLILAHVEKAVVAVCGILFVLFVVQSARLETYDKKPEDFGEITQSASANVEKADPEEIEVASLLKINEELRAPVKDDNFNFLNRFRRSYNFGQNFREQPTILTPRKPQVQDNRGLIPVYKTDVATNKRLTRKVPQSEARFAVTQTQQQEVGMFQGAGMSAPGMMSQMLMGQGMGGMGMGMGADMGGSDMMMDGRGGYGSSMGYGGGYGSSMGYGGGYGDMAAMAQMGMMSGNENMYASMGFAMPEMGEMGMMSTEPEAPKAVADRRPRTIINRDILAGKEKKKDEKSKKTEKEDQTVEEYIVDMVGRHWVEIIASFPHSDQIRKFVEALREPAPFVGLRYALAEVERRELNESNEWTDWDPIPLAKQFSVVQNAIAYEPEMYADVVMKGLCMNIPKLQTTYKELLTLPEFEEPEMAEYSERYLDPRGWELRQEMAKNPKKSYRQPYRPGAAPAATKTEEKKEDPKKLMQRSGVVKLEGKNATAKDVKKAQKEQWNNRYMVKDAMIRFWDFTVVPGRRYQYRVRVRVFNPNYNRNDVADPSYKSSPFLVGNWSEPSEEVLVEPDVHWYAADPAARTRTDRAEVEIHYWSRTMGEWITKEVTQRPGDVIGLSGIASVNPVVEWNDLEKVWVPKEVNLYQEQKFDTHDILLAIEGGRETLVFSDGGSQKRLTLDLPKEIVAVNEFGDLVRRDSYTDINNPIRESVKEGYKALIDELKSLTKPPATGGMGPGSSADPLDPLGRMP